MAIVLNAFASYVGDLLKQVAADELTLLLGVSGDIASLDDRLRSLNDILADAERRRITDESVQGWVRKLKDAMYEATDILDLCHLKAMQRGGSSGEVGCLGPLLFCLRNPVFAHDIGSRIKALNARLDAISKSASAFSFLKLEAYEDMTPAARRRNAAADRKTDPVLERSAVVGEKIEEDTRTLVGRLTANLTFAPANIMVFAVVGAGGIGKTTLAKKVFNDEAIQERFDRKIWLSVTQEVNEVELLRTAIKFAGGAGAGDSCNKSLLVPALVDAIRDKTFLLVLDDVWSDRAWNGLLKAAFSHGAAGSRVLVTTRHDAVARGMQAAQPFHHVDLLSPEDAWSLLKKQIVSSEMDEVEIDETLKDIGMEIIEKCGGLPLAVKVIGGLLCKRGNRRADWEKILHDSIWSVPQIPDELNYAIYLSYQDLHPCLKQCFLHYSLLPKNAQFFNDTVISMWISEGFLHGNTDDLEELGEECYKELIDRNLIEPDVGYAGEWISTMHDVVRSFAQHLSRDEALVISSTDEMGKRAIQSHKFLRLSIETNALQQGGEFGWKILQGQKSVRTLILIGELKISPGDSLITFPNLRTLHIENANCTSALVESLHQLKHLRYISLKCNDITRLPDNIGKMRFLQYLGLVCENLVGLPNSIIKLGDLRYLDLSGTSISTIPRQFCGLTSLRNLYGFPTQVDGEWCSLQELGPLAQLRVLGLSNLENVPVASFATEARLGEKSHLSYLILQCSSRVDEGGFVASEEGVSEEEQRQIEEVLDELTPPPCLENIEIIGYFGERPPRWMMSREAGAYERLMILMMQDLACCTQLPDGLCSLPSLHYFQVSHAPAIKRVGPEFVMMQPLSSQRRHFPRLKTMYLIGMVEWEEWEWEHLNNVQVMAALEDLMLQNCKLRCLPPGLSSQAMALTSMYLYNIQQLNSVVGFASLVKLTLYGNPDLERVLSLPKLQKLDITCCPKMMALEGVPELQRLELQDLDMEELPTYLLKDARPRHLVLDCSLELLTIIAIGESGPEWSKLSHVQNVKAYADEGDNERKWHVLYTRDPYSLETNINDKGKSFLLVLDDERAWHGLLKAPFSHGAAGSRVLVTTRNVSSNDLEELEIDDTLKDIGMKIIEKCDGLPLAVKVMGGLLRRRDKRAADWGQVLHDFIWSVPPHELNDAYQDLDSCLRQCFLHYSLLPKNVDMFVETVVGMWISEGFLHGATDDLQKLGKNCYKELIYRNLIEPDVGYADESVCSMHDVVRSFAHHLARDEARVVSSTDETGNGALKSQKFLRLTVETNNDKFAWWKLLQGQKSLRTLIVIGELKINPGDSFINFSSLRTLHIQDANCTSFMIDSLHQLKHLRYIFLKSSYITRLLQNISKLKLLQYLTIESEILVKLPDSIGKLVQLRHLDLIGISINGIPRQFLGLTNLRILYGFPALADGDWCSLQELGTLAQLQALTLENLGSSHLSQLILSCSSRLGENGLVQDEKGVAEEEQGRIEEVFDKLTPPLCLERITIAGYFGQHLPRWMMSRAALGAYERLMIVTMEDLACCTQLPDGLCQLPCLHNLSGQSCPCYQACWP
uniref:Uncharacterized protein n=1 Tax=Leersia perrieri TaxID=77586 RepID=A0A0D9XVP9_9ORYZ